MTLTPTAEGVLTGRWVWRTTEGLATVNGQPFAMQSGRDYKAAFSHDAPGVRAYGLMVSHGVNQAAGETGGVVEVRWLPTVMLIAIPSSVAEGGGAQRVSVTARLSGRPVEDVAKSVTVRLGGGTATAGTDFRAVDDFTIRLLAGTQGALGGFELVPVADADAEGTETVAKPSNGRITGPGIDCGGQGADCSEVYLDGASVTLKAAADASHLLGGWTGDCSGAGDCALGMDADKAVGASFGAKRTLTVAQPSNGRVTGKVGAAAVIDCGADCVETLIDGTVVALQAVAADGHRFDDWGGACASEATASCSVAMDADRSVSASFAVGSTAGRCDEAVVDGCAAGTLNRSAFGDTPSHHRWRCDGSSGGAHSPQCAKAKAGCAAGGRSWSAGGLSCSGSVAAASSGASATVRDGGDPTRGSARFLCDDGAWVGQTGATCTVDLGCGASENSCRTAGVRATGLSSAAPVDGRCAATETAACWSGTPDRNSPADVVQEDGACGTKLNECEGGTSHSLSSTNAAFRWECRGIDGKKRWSCLGADGGSSWRCEYGGRSRSCSLPTYAVSDYSCSEPDGTADSYVCLLCKSGYAKDENGDCVRAYTLTVEVSPANTGTVTTKDTLDGGFNCPQESCSEAVRADKQVTLSVAAKDGYDCGPGTVSVLMNSDKTVEVKCTTVPVKQMHELTVVVNPANAGTVTTKDTLEGDFSCTATCSEEVEDRKQVTLSVVAEDGYECSLDDDAFKMTSDKTVTASCIKPPKCGAVEMNCTLGTAKQAADSLVPPVNKWTCANAGKTKNCEDPAPPPSCDKATENLALVGQELTCECKDGFVRDNGECKLPLKADAGGSGGHYLAWRTLRRLRGGGSIVTFTVRVSASATGGVPPYSFKWLGARLNWGSGQATYVFPAREGFPVSRTVTVRDSASPPNTDTATATIDTLEQLDSEASAGGGEDGGSAFEVPLGGELVLIWGGDGTVAARSEDAGVASVSVSSPALLISGLALGETQVIVEVGDGALVLPVVVR